jgi:uncharacterized protein
VTGSSLCSLEVQVVPKASRTALERNPKGGWRIRVHAAPADGEANRAVIRFLAREVLGLPQQAVRLVAGAASRRKRFEIDLGEAELLARLEAASKADRKGGA